MLKYIYDIFLTSTKNQCSDLVIQALPMLLADARTGVRQYTAEETDLAALHEAELDEQAMAAFIGRHYTALVEAYRLRDRAAFDAVVAQCEQADKEAEAE